MGRLFMFRTDRTPLKQLFSPRVTLKHVTYPIADYTEPLLRPTSTDITSFFSVRRSANYNYTFQQMSEECRQKMLFFLII